MKRILRSIIMLGSTLAIATTSAQAYTVYLDMDVSTPPPPPPGIPGPPIPPPGIDGTIAVTSGTTVTVIAYILHTTGGAVFDSVGMDVQYGLPTDTAAAVYMPGTNVAGGLAGTAAPTIDLVGGGPTGPGAPLALAPLPAVPPYTGNMGGSGFFDATPSFFGGFGVGGPPAVGTYYDVMGMSFMVTGSPGDVVTLTPSGIFAPGGHAPGTPAPGVPLVPGGDAVYNSVTGMTVPGGLFVGGTITIVPEPSSTALFAVGLLGFFLRRKR